MDPRTKEATEHPASNEETPDRPVLGDYHFDMETGEYREEPHQGKIKVDPSAGATRTEEADRTPGKDHADGVFRKAEMGQIKATAVTIGIPTLRAKTNVAIKGVGRKFSGIWYVTSVRHQIGDGGYLCELKLRKNAAGKGASEKATKPTEGEKNEQPVDTRDEAELPEVVIDLEEG